MEVFTMEHTSRWTAEIHLYEHDDGSTKAEARLLTADGNQITGHGSAQRNPQDVYVPEIGDELAVARAFGDLSRRLMRMVADDMEGVIGHPVHIDG
jgi:hypothetical protein